MLIFTVYYTTKRSSRMDATAAGGSRQQNEKKKLSNSHVRMQMHQNYMLRFVNYREMADGFGRGTSMVLGKAAEQIGVKFILRGLYCRDVTGSYSNKY